MPFVQANRKKSKLRMTLDGPAGSGKTYTALRFAHALSNGGRIAFIDTERGSASKYAGEAPDGKPWNFDVMELTTFSPEVYTQAINEAGRAGYTVLVIDSLSHAWEGVGGALEIKDRGGSNQYTAWRTVTPIHNRMVDAILQSPLHVITCMRSRMEYVQDVDEKGKVIGIRKVGMSPIQRPGMEYEFDVVCDLDWSHILTVSKSRCSAIADLKMEKPGADFMQPVMAWLEGGEPVTQTQTTPTQPMPTVTPQPTPTIAPEPTVTLDTLLNLFGADKILEAGAGKFPETQEQVQAIFDKLAA